MKKYLVLFSILFLLAISMQAQQKQGLKLEGNLGIPIGDYTSSTVFGFGLDVTYLFNITGSFQLGPSVGYHNFFGKGSKQSAALGGSTGSDVQIVPFSASARYYFFDELFIGTDIGYGLHLDKNLENESGFYFKPKVGFSWGPISTILSYSTIIGELSTFNAAHLGFEVAF